MGVSKTTDTIFGATASILVLEQYSVRAKMQIPGSKAIAATHRASSGTTRTITLAEPHGMVTGAYFLYGNFENANYNPTSTLNLGIVTAVPAPNQLSYVSSASLTEETTGDASGQIVVLGWKRLRIGMHFAVPRTSTATWDCGLRALGLGIAQGAYPVGSELCGRWCGFTNAAQSSMSFFASGDKYGNYIGFNQRVGVKVGASWGTELNFNVSDYISVRRIYPSAMFLELYKGSGGNLFAIMTKTVGLTWMNLCTPAKFLAILKSPISFTSSDQTFEGLTLTGVGGTSTGTSTAPLVVGHGADLYLEPFIRVVGQSMEIMGIGYAVTP